MAPVPTSKVMNAFLNQARWRMPQHRMHPRTGVMRTWVWMGRWHPMPHRWVTRMWRWMQRWHPMPRLRWWMRTWRWMLPGPRMRVLGVMRQQAHRAAQSLHGKRLQVTPMCEPASSKTMMSSGPMPAVLRQSCSAAPGHGGCSVCTGIGTAFVVVDQPSGGCSTSRCPDELHERGNRRGAPEGSICVSESL